MGSKNRWEYGSLNALLSSQILIKRINVFCFNCYAIELSDSDIESISYLLKYSYMLRLFAVSGSQVSPKINDWINAIEQRYQYSLINQIEFIPLTFLYNGQRFIDPIPFHVFPFAALHLSNIQIENHEYHRNNSSFYEQIRTSNTLHTVTFDHLDTDNSINTLNHAIQIRHTAGLGLNKLGVVSSRVLLQLEIPSTFSLTFLDLSDHVDFTYIPMLVNFLTHTKTLTKLKLERCHLTDEAIKPIFEIIMQRTQNNTATLQHIYLAANRLQYIPIQFQLHGWQSLSVMVLTNNAAIQSPPRSVTVTSEKLLQYWRDLSTNATHISRVRLCLTGCGAAGKTTLTQALTADLNTHATFLSEIQGNDNIFIHQFNC
jgi:hypothetical protein